MSFLPRSNNDYYAGSHMSAWFLLAAGVFTVIPGCIHVFLPDGGAGVIAHSDLSAHRDVMVAMFTGMGALQIAHGLAEIIISLRYRALTPLMLSLVLLERGLMAFDGWVGTGARTGEHPPEHYVSLIVTALALWLLGLSLRRRRRSGLSR